MGLDIRSKKDYMRFNIFATEKFDDWCVKNLGVYPFICWDGCNGEEYYLTEDQVKKFVEWDEAFLSLAKKREDSLVLEKNGIAEIVGEIMFRMNDCTLLEQGKKDEVFYREELIEYWYLRAFVWHLFVQSVIKYKYIYYG